MVKLFVGEAAESKTYAEQKHKKRKAEPGAQSTPELVTLVHVKMVLEKNLIEHASITKFYLAKIQLVAFVEGLNDDLAPFQLCG